MVAHVIDYTYITTKILLWNSAMQAKFNTYLATQEFFLIECGGIYYDVINNNIFLYRWLLMPHPYTTTWISQYEYQCLMYKIMNNTTTVLFFYHILHVY